MFLISVICFYLTVFNLTVVHSWPSKRVIKYFFFDHLENKVKEK